MPIHAQPNLYCAIRHCYPLADFPRTRSVRLAHHAHHISAPSGSTNPQPVFAYALLIERGEGTALDFQAQDGSALPAELSVLAQVVQGQNILKLGARQGG